ncbi:MAG: helix-turn-helix transcriptional regulator [Lachnospiraceae bacterium]|nr:helix-turn-helix transcriptional regulator [Lachnospiraceae bacterium]
MKTLETNDWMILNSIIYKIYTTENVTEMRSQLLEQLKMVLDFDSADFFLADDETGADLVEQVTYNCDEDGSSSYNELDYSRGIMYSGKSMVYRETDIITDEKRVETEYYKKVYKPNNWHYSLQMILGRNKKFLGVVTLYRTIGKDNFRYDDVFVLDMLKDHLAYRLYTERSERSANRDKISVTEATDRYDLTKREHTILQLLMDGHDNQEICDELSISINTIKKHILNIYRKIGVKNRVQLFKMIKEKE